MNHINIICAWCEVHARIGDWAIWYRDGGFDYADVFDPEEGWCSYSCNSAEEWQMLTER